MFCSECGAEAAGNFCWSCGQALKSSVALPPTPPPADWSQLTDYETLIRVPEVRDRIARAAATCKKRLTGEEFLDCCDKVLAPVTGGMPLALIRKVAQPISEKLGIKSSHARTERYAQAPGEVIVALLCSFARNGQSLIAAHNATDACTLKVTIPSNVWFLEGAFDVTIRAAGSSTIVEAAITIPGQLYDWGKSRRCLDQLFGDIASLAKCA